MKYNRESNTQGRIQLRSYNYIATEFLRILIVLFLFVDKQVEQGLIIASNNFSILILVLFI